MTILKSDRYIDYTRAGKIVYRAIERTQTIKMKSEDGSTVVQHLIEFIADDKVFGVVCLDGPRLLTSSFTSASAAQFSSGLTVRDDLKLQYFYVTVPQYDYFEYVEVTGSDVKLGKATDPFYEQMKQGPFKMAKEGHLYDASQVR